MDVKPYKECLSVGNKFRRMIWNIVYTILFRPTPNILFWRWRVLLLRLFGARLGNHCKIRSSAKIWAPWNLRFGDYVAVGNNAEIYNVNVIEVGTKVVISQGAYLCTASHDIQNSLNPLITAPIQIGNQAWVAAQAFVGMGVTIGQGAVVGARAVVTKNVAPWTVVAGNPAVKIKERVII